LSKNQTRFSLILARSNLIKKNSRTKDASAVF
jgi:hypothetical protein